MTDPILLTGLAALILAAGRQRSRALSPEGRAVRAAREHITFDPRLPVHNPNLCEDCIGEARPEDRYDLADTGRCGDCGQVNEVWDLEHLGNLKAQGLPVYSEDGITRIQRPIRNSHVRYGEQL